MSETIQVGYRHIGTEMGKEFYHKFLLYTNNQGIQKTISGWADVGHKTNELPYGYIKVEADKDYTYGNPDYPKQGENYQKIYFEPIIQKENLQDIWEQMSIYARSKNGIYPYDPIKQNSNSLADSVLRDAGLPSPKQDGVSGHWAPASDKDLKMDFKPQDPQINGVTKNLSYVVSEVDVEQWQQPINQTKTIKKAELTQENMQTLLFTSTNPKFMGLTGLPIELAEQLMKDMQTPEYLALQANYDVAVEACKNEQTLENQKQASLTSDYHTKPNEFGLTQAFIDQANRNMQESQTHANNYTNKTNTI